MVIANPIYDVVFKRLMENDRVAKFFIGTLLEQIVESVEVQPQEFTYVENRIGFAIFRLDFIATIKTETGEYKKVLIEIQKARNQIDLMRFRNYLAEQYKKKDIINGQKMVLPIITIYILGFKLPEIEVPCLKVERSYKDLVNRTILNTKSEFVEKLTHDSFIVQVERITERYQTRLDKLLSVFEQRYFFDDAKIVKEYNHNADLEELKIITGILNYAGTNPLEREKIEIEIEAWRTVNAMLDDERESMKRELEESRKVLNENKKELDDTSKALDEKEKALNDTSKALDDTSKALDDTSKALDDTSKALDDTSKALDDTSKALDEKEKANQDLLQQLEELKRQLGIGK